MRFRSAALLWMALSLGCHPYGDEMQGEFNAGAVDPFNFPPAYRANTGSFTREIGGSGRFVERKATAHGAPANYFFFPFPPSLVATTGYAAPAAGTDALKINPAALPQAFEFDPTSPPQDTASCTAPQGYSYDQFRDDVRYDRQGNLVSALPNANFAVGGLPSWTYIPVAQHVAVTSNGEACQSVKSDQTLLSRADVTVPRDATTNAPVADALVAWAVIDPGAPVYRVGQTATTSTGLAVQHFGWYRQFLMAYLDGGVVPTKTDTSGTTPVTRMVSQKLYFPRSGVTPASGNGLGAGNDLMQFQRGEPGYTPVCQVFSYTLPTGQSVPTDVAALETAAAADKASWNIQSGFIDPKTGAITPTYAFCLQAL